MDFEFDLENRIVDPEDIPEDADIENPLRPRTLSEYIGLAWEKLRWLGSSPMN